MYRFEERYWQLVGISQVARNGYCQSSGFANTSYGRPKEDEDVDCLFVTSHSLSLLKIKLNKIVFADPLSEVMCDKIDVCDSCGKEVFERRPGAL
jgi:hypothetical protein